MNLYEMILLAFANLRRTKMRTFLTTLGVVVGIGALTSMVSFGTGMQKNISDTFKDNDMFTSVSVTSLDLESIGRFEGEQKICKNIPLTDSVLEVIRAIDLVEIAYPEMFIPSKLVLFGKETHTSIQAVPTDMAAFKPFNAIAAGTFYSNDSANQVVILSTTLRDLKIIVETPDNPIKLSAKDSLDGFRVLPSDSIIGKKIQVVTIANNKNVKPISVFFPVSVPAIPSFGENTIEYTICGIIRSLGSFGPRYIKGGIVIPIETAKRIPQLGFNNVWDLLDKKGNTTGYPSIYVKVRNIKDLQPLRSKLDEMQLKNYSVSDQMEEFKRTFLILDSVLGAIGFIALFVAALGIINTMVMSILERTREIGVMKAIGGSEGQIRTIFFIEAGVIGLLGALVGLLVGWGVTRVANFIVNTQFMPTGEEPVNLFYFPAWLILGSIMFSILVSLLAGMYPAFRAARVDPVTALRHD